MTWNTEFIFEINVSIGRDGVLNPCELQISVKQEVNEGRSTEKVGSVQLNLSEFAGERMVTKKILLRDSNVNSVLKMTIDMKLLKGDPSFLVPRSTFAEDIVDLEKIGRETQDLTLSRIDHDKLSTLESVF